MARGRGLARKVRAGLKEDNSSFNGAEDVLTRKRHPAHTVPKGDLQLDDIWCNKPISEHIRQFALVLLLGITLISLYLAIKKFDLKYVVSLLLVGGLIYQVVNIYPSSFVKFWRSWMEFAYFIGVGVTYTLLFLIWLLIFIPMSLIIKVVKKNLLDLSFKEGEKSTYWLEVDKKQQDFNRLKLQF